MNSVPDQPDIKITRPRPSMQVLALVMAMTAVGPMFLNIVIPALPGLATKFRTDLGTAQLTISLFLFGLATSQILLGPLSDRFGRRPVVLGGFAVTALSSVISIVATSIEVMIVERILQGLGASTGMVIGRAIMRDLYDRNRAATMIGWVTTVTTIAPMIAPLIGGLLDTAFGWEAIFVFNAVTACGLLVWGYFGLPETRPDQVTGGGARFLWKESRLLFGNSSFNLYVIYLTLGGLGYFCFLGAGPFLVMTLMGRSTAEYGAWFVLLSAGYMLGNSIAGRFSVRYGIDTMITWGIVVEVVGIVIAIATTPFLSSLGPAPLFIAFTIYLIGNGIMQPNTIAGAVSVRPDAAGTASGVIGFVQMSIGAAFMQAMSHWVVSTASPWPLQLSVGGFVMTITLMLLVGKLRRPSS